MSILGFVAVVLALSIFLWFAAVFLPVDREGLRLPIGAIGTPRCRLPFRSVVSEHRGRRGEVNPPATLRFV